MRMNPEQASNLVDLRFDFEKKNFNALAAKLQDRSSGRLIRIGSDYYDEEHLAEVDAVFRPAPPRPWAASGSSTKRLSRSTGASPRARRSRRAWARSLGSTDAPDGNVADAPLGFRHHASGTGRG